MHCLDCARKQAPGLEGFVCLEEYRMSELMDVFDNFNLHPVVIIIIFLFNFFSKFFNDLK